VLLRRLWRGVLPAGRVLLRQLLPKQPVLRAQRMRGAVLHGRCLPGLSSANMPRNPVRGPVLRRRPVHDLPSPGVPRRGVR
jgi:hypothetical protein